VQFEGFLCESFKNGGGGGSHSFLVLYLFSLHSNIVTECPSIFYGCTCSIKWKFVSDFILVSFILGWF